MITEEDVRKLEDSLTKDQKQVAFRRARDLGWTGYAPMWVWYQIFSDARRGNDSEPSIPQIDNPDTWKNCRL